MHFGIRQSSQYTVKCGAAPHTWRNNSDRDLELNQTNVTSQIGLPCTEHKRALRSGKAAQSVVADHVMEEDHTINWEDAEVVDYNPRYRHRCMLEAWHIRTEQHKMNRDEGPHVPFTNSAYRNIFMQTVICIPHQHHSRHIPTLLCIRIKSATQFCKLIPLLKVLNRTKMSGNFIISDWLVLVPKAFQYARA